MYPIVYTSPTCQPCKQLKRWLQANNINYTEKGPEEAIEAGFRSVPVLVYRDHVIHGLDIPALEKVFPE